MSTLSSTAVTTAGTPQLEKPSSMRPRRTGGGNGELYAWLFMRISGLALFVLVLGHLLIMNILDGGVHRINFAFVAGRWSSPFWQFWDLSMLWLAQLHGGNGLRTVIDDYARGDVTRFWLKLLLYTSILLIVGVGSFVIFTFDPEITG